MDKLVTKWFMRWARRTDLSDVALKEALVNLEKGLSAADLGKSLYKVRVKREGQGKRSGYRTIVVYREKKRAIFLYGFAKNEKENLTSKELDYFQKLGNDLLKLSRSKIEIAIKDNVLFDLEDVK
jgi:hypothetical protein